MKILALVPARGGSKRLPGKNLRLLGGKPLIAWSIEAVRGLPDIAEVLVSTDCPQIAAAGVAAGAIAPWLRPAQLASDSAGSVDVALHALDWYEATHGAVDAVLLLQPTSPFRSRATIARGLALFGAGNGAAVLGVSPCTEHPLWTLKLVDGQLQPFVEGAALTARSQDLPPAFVVNGAFYLVSPAALRARRSFIGEATLPLVIDDADEALDIDTAADWALAEQALARRGGAQHGQ